MNLATTATTRRTPRRAPRRTFNQTPPATARGEATTAAAVEVQRLRRALDGYGCDADAPRSLLDDYSAALGALLQHCEGIVVDIAARWHAARPSPRYEFDDLKAQGDLGILRAVETYDPTTGYQFNTYAIPWVRQKIQEFLAANAHPFHIGRRPQEMAVAVQKERRLPAGQRRTGEAVLAFLAGSVCRIGDRMEPGGPPVPEPPDPVDDLDDGEAAEDRRKRLDSVLAMLTGRYAEVIRRRYLTGKPETLVAIARDWGVSKERVRQHEVKAIELARRAAERLRLAEREAS